jgi:hypothetical protein
VSLGDETIEGAANRLQEAADRAASHGGLRARLGDELADDAAFLRKLKPSLILARMRGGEPAAPNGPQVKRRQTSQSRRSPGHGPSPYLVVGAALVAGILVARLIDWRSHAHPRN